MTDRILGVDPGSLRTGWGVVEITSSRKLHHVAHGTVHTTKGAPFVERLHEVYRGLRDVMQSHTPTHLSLELAFVGKNAQSALKLGQIRGAVLALALESGLSVHEYTPSQIKQAATGNGRSAKEQVASMVAALLGLTPPLQADAADALAAALCHLLRPPDLSLPEGPVLSSSRSSRRRRKPSRPSSWPL